MVTQFGLPVIESATALPEALREAGIILWDEAAPVMSLPEYMGQPMNDSQRDELKFAPTVSVRTLVEPGKPTEEPYRGFFVPMRPWACVFTLLPGRLVPLVAEYKHGINKVVIVPPCGVPSRDELRRSPLEALLRAGRREHVEETGIELASAIPLLGSPIAVSPRQTDLSFLPVWGVAAHPIVPQPLRLDRREHLFPFLMPLSEWRVLMVAGEYGDLCGITTTMLALDQLGISTEED